MRRRAERARDRAPDQPADDVVLDIEIDGYRCVLFDAEARSGQGPRDGGCDVTLTSREQEIARLVAKGHPNKIIASILEISVWTVATYMRRIFAKLGVTSRAAMVSSLMQLRLMR